MSSFPIGCNVILKNLVKGSQYNGETGIVKTNCDERGRQNVLLLDSNKMVAVKPHNMIVMPSQKVEANPRPVRRRGGSNVRLQNNRPQQRRLVLPLKTPFLNTTQSFTHLNNCLS